MHTPTQLAGLGLLKRARLITHLSDGSVPSGARKYFLFAKWCVPWAAARLQPGSSESFLESVGAALGLSPNR